MPSLPRRAVLGGLAAAAATACLEPAMSAPSRQPVVYLPHGGGPWPFVDVGFGTAADWAPLRRYLEALPGSVPAPRAILCVSAHWEERVPTLMTAPKPKMFYDYHGFPPAAYALTWPAPGAPDLAARVRRLLDEAGMASAEDPHRGFDHGTFVPLKVSWPSADIPTTQLSLVAGLDPAVHLRIGRALAPLRDEGVLILGSGLSFHNLRAFGHPQAREVSRQFDAWLGDAVTRPDADRDAALIAWESAPYARVCHPREEHLLPLMVCAGASAGDAGRVTFNDVLMGTWVSAVHWG